MASVPEIRAEVAWRPFFLDPTIPSEGLDRRDYLAAKFGKDRLASLHAPFEDARAQEGVPYDFDKITRTPNTLDAHRLIRWSHVEGKQNDVVERLFMAYWSEGRDIGNRRELADIAREAGMDIEQNLNADLDADSVSQEVSQAMQMGVQGVPCFILSGKYGLSGAQPVEQLIAAIEKVAA